MEKFKNIDTISKRLETPIKNLHENLLEGHTGGNEVIDIIKNGISNKSVMLITEIQQEMKMLKKEIERLKGIDSKTCC